MRWDNIKMMRFPDNHNYAQSNQSRRSHHPGTRTCLILPLSLLPVNGYCCDGVIPEIHLSVKLFVIEVQIRETVNDVQRLHETTTSAKYRNFTQ